MQKFLDVNSIDSILWTIAQRYSKDDMLMEAECVEEYGEWIHM